MLSFVRLLTLSFQLCLIFAAYSQDNATRTLYFAYGAYCPQQELYTWTCKWCKYISNFEIANVTNTHYYKFDVSTRKVPSIQYFSPSSGQLGDALNLSATNSYESLDLRKTSGSRNSAGAYRTALTGNDTLSSTVNKDGFVLDLLGGVLEGDKIAVHYVADADINKNFKRT